MGVRVLLCACVELTLSDASARMGHDAETGVEDGSDDGDAGTVPAESSVCDVVVLLEPLLLAVSVDPEDVLDGDLGGAAAARLLHVLLDDGVLRVGARHRRQVAGKRLVLVVERVAREVGLVCGVGLCLGGLLLCVCLHGLRHLDVVEHVEQVLLVLELLVAADDGRGAAPEVVRDQRVEARRQLVELRSRARLQRRLDLRQDVEALGDLRLGQLAERHLRRVDLEGLHRLLEHAGIETKSHKFLNGGVELGRPEFRARGGRARRRRPRRVVEGVETLCQARLLLLVGAVVHLQQRVLATLGAEVRAVVPLVARLCKGTASESQGNVRDRAL